MYTKKGEIVPTQFMINTEKSEKCNSNIVVACREISFTISEKW